MDKEKSFFSKRLKNILFEKGFTQYEFAQKLGVGQEIISRWINDVRKPSMASLKKISAALDVPLNYFLEGSVMNSDAYSVSKINENEDRLGLLMNLIQKQNEVIEEKTKVFEEKNKRLEAEIISLKKEMEIYRDMNGMNGKTNKKK